MEFSYKKSLIITYAFFGIVILIIIAFTIPFIPIFPLPLIAVDLIALALAYGAFKRCFSIMFVTILLEREGIHFFHGKRKVTSIPWHIVDDFSFSGTRCVLLVGDEFYYVSRELNNFEEFERQIVEQLTLPPEKRGSNLPKLDKPQSMGGIRDDTPPVTAKRRPLNLDESADEDDVRKLELLTDFEPDPESAAPDNFDFGASRTLSKMELERPYSQEYIEELYNEQGIGYMTAEPSEEDQAPARSPEESPQDKDKREEYMKKLLSEDVDLLGGGATILLPDQAPRSWRDNPDEPTFPKKRREIGRSKHKKQWEDRKQEDSEEDEF